MEYIRSQLSIGINYLVTFLPMPTGVANTFPGKITFTVYTSGVSHTFITGWTRPALFNTKKRENWLLSLLICVQFKSASIKIKQM